MHKVVEWLWLCKYTLSAAEPVVFKISFSGSNVGPLDPGTHQGIQVLPACACSHWARGRVPSLLGLLLHRLLLWGLGGGLDPLQPLSSGGRLPLEAFGHWLGKSF